MIELILSLALISSAPQASTAPAPASNDSSASKAPVSRDDEIVCRRERNVGSNRPVRTCHPRKVWREMNDTTRRQLEEGNRGGAETLPGSNSIQ